MPTEGQSKWIPGRYPAPGTSPIGDAIRKRRGERGITALDAALLHVPPAAEGWNTLLGAVRTKGELGGDIRELMVGVSFLKKLSARWNALFYDRSVESLRLTAPRMNGFIMNPSDDSMV
jgi:hypothetical protein